MGTWNAIWSYLEKYSGAARPFTMTWDPEIAVASTKAYTTQIMVLNLMALHFARVRGTITPERAAVLRAALRKLLAPSGARVVSLQLGEPTLEDVFLSLSKD